MTESQVFWNFGQIANIRLESWDVGQITVQPTLAPQSERMTSNDKELKNMTWIEWIYFIRNWNKVITIEWPNGLYNVIKITNNGTY